MVYINTDVKPQEIQDLGIPMVFNTRNTLLSPCM